MNVPAKVTHRCTTDAAHRLAVEKVLSHMKQDLACWEIDLSLDALARQGCYSKSHLISIFEEVTGTTPHHFLTSLRIEKAKCLLLSTDASVTEIALEVGYSSFPTFSRTFAEYVGLSPSTFRAAPSLMRPSQFLAAVTEFIARDQVLTSVDTLDVNIQGPTAENSAIFVGSYTRGVPQGRPESGTVLMHPGRVRIRKPERNSFQLLAVLVDLAQIRASDIHTLRYELGASVRVQFAETSCIDVTLRPFRMTDPPLVVSLVALLDKVDEYPNSG